MTTAIATVRKGSGQAGHSHEQEDEGWHTESEILPDTIAEILRRMQEEFKCPICLGTMEEPVSTGCNHTFCRQCVLYALDRRDGCPLCKAHVTKRSLNTVGHLGQLIGAFLQLKEAFELEEDSTLSQVPRQYVMETRDDLTQLYPYPEKLEESSEDAPVNKDSPKVQQREMPPSLQEGSATDTEDFQAPTVPGNRKVWHAADKRPSAAAQEKGPSNTHRKTIARQAIDRQPSVAPRAGGTIDIVRESFDCFDVNLDTLPVSQAAALAEQMLAMMSAITLGKPPILAPPPQEQQQISTSTPQDTEPYLSRVKQEDEDEDDRATLSPLSLSDAEDVKEEPETVALSQSFAPTQERRSTETNPILCATVMTLTKKHQLENTAKVLMARVADDLVTRPTHVVMDLSQEQSESGGGRTVKYFLGILRGCWVLRYEWILASMNAGYWVHESPYQIYDNEFGINAPKISRASHLGGDPPLFAGCEVQLFGTFNTPTKDELELMIEAGGGMVVSQLFSWSTRSTVLRSDGADNAHPTRHIILYNQGNDRVRNLRRLKAEIRSVSDAACTLDRRVQVVPHREFLDCIASYDISTMGESDLYADLA